MNDEETVGIVAECQVSVASSHTLQARIVSHGGSVPYLSSVIRACCVDSIAVSAPSVGVGGKEYVVVAIIQI